MRDSSFCVLACAILFTVFLANPSQSQEASGQLAFRLLDEGGRPISGAEVRVTGENLPGVRVVESNVDGYVRVASLPVGKYDVTISHEAYQRVSVQEAVVQLGKTNSLGDIQLSKQLITETVVVVGKREIIDFTSSELGTNLNVEELASLPSDRDYRSLISYLPQTNASFLGDAVNIAGSTGSENLYTIDGVNVTDPFNGAFGSGLPYNFIREVQVITEGYQAEFGRSNGGVINVITHSGSNEFKGQGYAYFSNNDFAADNRRGVVELQNADFTRYDIGVGVGGPIVRDKLWFYAAYNPSVEREDLEIPGMGFHTDERISHQFAGKLTWLASTSTKLDFTAFGDPSRHDRVGSTWFNDTPSTLANVDPFLSKVDRGGYGFSLSGNHAIGGAALVEASISHFNTREKMEPATRRGEEEVFFMDNTTATWSGGMGNRQDNRSLRNAARATTTYYLNRHDLKAGLEYEDVAFEALWEWKGSDGGYGVLIKNADDQWLTLDNLTGGEAHYRYPGAFIQDSWSVTDRLRLNLGLRWDGMYFYEPGGELRQQINDQWAPRTGFVYQVDERGSQKISGSYGRFYEQLATFVLGANLIPRETEFLFWPCDPRNPDPGCEGISFLNDSVSASVDDLKGQHYDEFVLGYERRIGDAWKAGLSAMHRELREAIQDAEDPETGGIRFGNPGRGNLSDFPDPVRRYSALELTLGRSHGKRTQLRASYVLSRTYGNYTGVYGSDEEVRNAHGGFAWQTPDFLVNGTGLLPNDRTHVFKLYGSHAFDVGLTLGGFFTAQSGTPLSEFGAHPVGISLLPLRQRGTNGRTPWIWDLNLRLAYDLRRLTGFEGRSRQRLLMDILHAFGQREAVSIDQAHFLVSSGDTYEEIVANQSSPNATYLQAKAFQPPMTIRLGIETTF